MFHTVRLKISIIHTHYNAAFRSFHNCHAAHINTTASYATDPSMVAPSKKPLLQRLFSCPHNIAAAQENQQIDQQQQHQQTKNNNLVSSSNSRVVSPRKQN